MEELVELHDVQGLIFKGYGNLKAGRYILLHFTDRAKAKKWLTYLASQITPASFSVKDISTATHIAFTYKGIARLGITEEEGNSFSREFTEGMVTEHRQRILGDFKEGDPASWLWGGPNDPKDIHVLLMLFATDEESMDSFYKEHAIKWQESSIDLIYEVSSTDLEQKEHFGFRDGIAQPVIKNAGRKESWHDANNINPGEFLFGYKNEYGKYTFSPNISADKDPEGILSQDKNFPELKDLGRNGSMLVFRQLQQDVKGFWKMIEKAAGKESDPEKRSIELIAAKMVGRWPNGAPLAKCPHMPDDKFKTFDNFGYAKKDFDGYNCPIGSHIRRANPRDNFLRNSTGKPEKDIEKSEVFMKRFRIIRRGRPYGNPVCAGLDPREILKTEACNTERGMLFICFNSNIGRQFELIQQTWINNPKFAELYEDPDPLVGYPEIMGEGATTTFTEQAVPLRKKVEAIPRFVWPRGGGYFFMPGINALKYLGQRQD